MLMSFALVSMFQEWCKLVADVVCFLDSCFDFSVKSSIFCKYAAAVLELSHFLELNVVDATGCAALLDCLSLADADFHIEFFTGGVQAVCSVFATSFHLHLLK